MAENKIQIILEMLDKASPEFKKINAEAIKQVKALENQTKDSNEQIDNSNKKLADNQDKNNKKQKEGLAAVSSAIRQFRSQLLVVTLAVGALAVATNEWAKRNKDARESLLEIQIAGSKVLSFIGKFSPILFILSAASKAFNDFTGDDKTDAITRAEFAIKEFNAQLKESNTLFVTGAISGAQYYQTLLDMGNESIAQRQLIGESLVELSSLQAELGNEQLLNDRTRTAEQIQLLNFYKDEHKIAHQGMAALTVAVGQTIQTSLSGALTNIITGVQSAKEAFAEFGKAMLKTIVDFMVQKVIASILEKTLLAGTVASSIAAGATVAAAWAPAAAAVSLATLGGNSGPAIAGMVGAAAVAQGLFGGGGVSGGGVDIEGVPFPPTFNVNPRALGGDEIVRKPTLFLAGENGPERATFTPLGSGGSGGGSIGDINIFIQGGINSEGASVGDMAEKLGFEFERRLRTARSF